MSISIVLASIFTYAVVGSCYAGYIKAKYNDYDGERSFVYGLFWPVVLTWEVLHMTELFLFCIHIGARISSYKKVSREKKETIRLQKSIEQKKLRIELQKIEQELDKELELEGHNDAQTESCL